MKSKYSKTQLIFLASNYKMMQIKELTIAFNAQFKTLYSATTIKSTLKRNGIKSGHKKTTGCKYKLLSNEQVEYLKLQYPKMSVKQLAVALNEKYELELSEGQLKTFVKNHKINSGRSGRFSKGVRPWNKGVVGVCKPNKGSFKKGAVPINLKPIGHERIGKDDYLLVKTDQVNPYTGHQGFYRQKHVVIWETHNGKVPEGCLVRFIDGNKRNFAPSNLEAVNKAVNLRLNQHDISSVPESLKPTVRILAELEVNTFKKSKESSCGTKNRS